MIEITIRSSIRVKPCFLVIRSLRRGGIVRESKMRADFEAYLWADGPTLRLFVYGCHTSRQTGTA